MPTYEYRCKACGHELEVVQSFSDEPLSTCDACGGQLRKVFGSVGIAFKGDGFYKNDSRGKKASASPAGNGDKADKTSSDAPVSSSGESSSSGAGSSSSTPATPAAAPSKTS